MSHPSEPAATWSAQVASAYRSAGTALTWSAGRLSGPELLQSASGAARWLTRQGLTPGLPVPALLSTTSPHAIALTIGGAASRRPLAPIATRLTAHELVPVVEALRCPLLLAEEGTVEVAHQVARRTGQRVVAIGELTPSSTPLEEPSGSDVAGILHTSGTTGTPKQVPLRQDRLATRARVHGDLLGLGPGCAFVTASPWHHIAGMGNVAVALARGAEVVALPRFDVDGWHQAQDLGATHCLLVPSMLEMLIARGALVPGALRALFYGAAPIHPETLRRVLALLPDVDVINIFGQTEGSPITWLSPRDHRRAARDRPDLLKSSGRAVPGIELRIAEPDLSGIGEVWARGEHLMLPDSDGWLRTGDLGRIDDDGYLFLSDRLGDKIIRGGENVFPSEVENVLVTHPAVAEAGVVGMPERRLGQAVAAFIVPADPEAPPSDAELASFARERLAGFKVPAIWRFVTSLPRTDSGKLQRRLLRRDGEG
jgi:acyl-CoA synthetase (AMP-forming)/AMP-acid ligase II